MTIAQGIPVADDQNTLKAGVRGPALLEDFHFREKIFHCDHQRIPERVVHARGYGAHGNFETAGAIPDLTAANRLAKWAGACLGSCSHCRCRQQWSFDLARDVRGFSVKLCTEQGNWDPVASTWPCSSFRMR